MPNEKLKPCPFCESGFSLHKITKPKFMASQIRIDGVTRGDKVSFPKQTHKLIVKRNGRIGYAKLRGGETDGES